MFPVILLMQNNHFLFCFLFCNRGDTSITAGSVRGSYAKPLSAGCRRYHLTHTPLGYDFVLGEISFSILQMQRRLRPNSNPRLEATYRHSQTLASYQSRHRGRDQNNHTNSGTYSHDMYLDYH